MFMSRGRIVVGKPCNGDEYYPLRRPRVIQKPKDKEKEQFIKKGEFEV